MAMRIPALIVAIGCSSSPQSQPAENKPRQSNDLVTKADASGSDGSASAPDLPGPPPPPATPPTVVPTLLEGSRIAGSKHIVPDDSTKTEIQKAGKERAVGSWKLCITDAGDVSSVDMVQSTGFSTYDAKIEREIRTWRYRPFLIDGKPAAVCTAVTFIYAQKASPPARR